jgi:hypothetical protein
VSGGGADGSKPLLDRGEAAVCVGSGISCVAAGDAGGRAVGGDRL